jgi:hypothetical protein
MATDIHQQADHRIRGWLERHEGPWSDSGAARIGPARTAYLSTMYPIDAAGGSYLFVLKHYDPQGRRAAREFEVLSHLGGDIAPAAFAFDNTGATFDAPVLLTSYIEPRIIEEWTDANLETLAALMARIHTDHRLMNLTVDRDAPASYSVRRELADETAEIDSFAPSPLKEELLRTLDILQAHIDGWEPLFDDGVIVYIHSDLPHHHTFLAKPRWQTVHWEWSRQSHPTRELARALWDMELTPEREQSLLARYHAKVPYRIDPHALAAQRVLQYFYNVFHVAFWLERTNGDRSHRFWQKAQELAQVVRLWVRMQVEAV